MINIKDAIILFEEYLLCVKQVTSTTLDSYKSDLTQFYEFLLNHNIENLQQIKLENLKEFLVHLHNNGNSAKTRSRKITTLKSFFNFSSHKFNIENLAIHLIHPKIEQKLPSYLSQDQVEKLFVMAAKDYTERGIRNKLIVGLLYGLGLRASEICDIKISDFKFDDNLLMVNGKGSKQRLIPVHKILMQEVKNYLESTRPRLNGERKSEYLFLTDSHKINDKISRQSIFKIIENLADCSGFKIYPHILRHSLATHFLAQGANIRQLQLLLGHESIATTQIYTHLDVSLLRNAYDNYHPRG